MLWLGKHGTIPYVCKKTARNPNMTRISSKAVIVKTISEKDRYSTTKTLVLIMYMYIYFLQTNAMMQFQRNNISWNAENFAAACCSPLWMTKESYMALTVLMDCGLNYCCLYIVLYFILLGFLKRFNMIWKSKSTGSRMQREFVIYIVFQETQFCIRRIITIVFFISYTPICSLSIYVENNTWICGNMKFISSVDQDISRVSKTNEWDILFNTRNNLIFPNIHVLFCLLYKTYSPIAPQK